MLLEDIFKFQLIQLVNKQYIMMNGQIAVAVEDKIGKSKDLFFLIFPKNNCGKLWENVNVINLILFLVFENKCAFIFIFIKICRFL